MPHNPLVTLADDTGAVLGSAANPLQAGPAAQTLLAQTSSAQTVTGNTAPLTMGGAQTLAVDVSVTAVTGTSPSMTLNVDRLAADGVSWVSVWASSAITATGVTSASIGPGCTVAAVLTGTVRLRWTITGTTPSFTFSASVVAR